MVLLVNPPVSKPGEPPAGVARLAGALRAHDIGVRVLDMSLEGLLHMLVLPQEPLDRWGKRAHKNVGSNLAALRTPATYRLLPKYSRAVADLQRALRGFAPGVGLADYESAGLSPVRSEDLLRAADRPESNPFYAYFSRRLEEVLREKEPAIIGISINYLSQALTAYALMGHLKRIAPKVRVVLGGGLITSWLKTGRRPPLEGLAELSVAGPGEAALLDMSGVHEVREGYVPYYADLPLDAYLSPGRVIPYSASSGCYWGRCTFCPEKSEGSGYRQRSIDKALADMAGLARQYSPALMHITDSSISPAVLGALTAQEGALPEWYGFVRVTAEMGDPGYAQALRRSGCVMLQLGVESGDQSVLEAMDKGMRVEEAEAALGALHRAGIATYVYLIFGTPEETEAEAEATLEFTRRNARHMDYLNLAVFNMPIGDTVGVSARAFSAGDLSLYTDFEHPGGWSRRRVRGFLERRFKRDRAVAETVKRQPPVFTSNHAAFLRWSWPG